MPPPTSRGRIGVRVDAELVPCHVKPDIEGFVEIRPDAKNRGVPALNCSEVRGGVDAGTQAQEHGSSFLSVNTEYL